MQQAAFSFTKYQVEKFVFDAQYVTDNQISIKLEPKGKLDTNESVFILYFSFFAFDSQKGFEQSFVECFMSAEFNFTEKINSINDIPAYFYANSIAIVFPYLRSFVSSLTIQANQKPIVLPTMNLSSLSSQLKENTEVI